MKIIYPVDQLLNFEKLRSEVLALIEQHSPKSNQIILQGLDSEVEEWQVGVGSIEELEVQEEKKYQYLNKSLVGSEIQNVINHYQGFRARIMLMPPRACYSVHADPTARIHIPIVTNDQCWMIWPYNNLCFRLPVGKAYYADTRRRHTFVNGSTENRIHIVMCVDN